MEAGGKEEEFESSEPASVDGVVEIVRECWPDAIFKAGESEVFAYRDQEALESWMEHGWTEENGASMLHVSLDGCRVTMTHS